MASSNSAASGRGSAPQCFVTVGATAGFRALLAEVASPTFFSTLAGLGFGRLAVQCGPDLAWFEETVAGLGTGTCGIEVEAFDLTNDMQAYMLACRSERGSRRPGCIISHAGTGTVLEAMRYSAPLVVVPNPTLMNNHQEELAEECEKQRWAVHGKLGHITEAVKRIVELTAEGPLASLPPYTPPPFPVPESERVKLFDWMVLTSYPEEFKRQQHILELRGTSAAGRDLGASSGLHQLREEQRRMDLD
ncbi:hypothetical protein QBC34DRAFT_120901 [Podospora aff. communis PSN243]|uniref:UDP-N-acetylglucosamine transferase subunit ALG13 n=1 Tax=Podospora aff. communis PSN243 TaxID=3040156 RepID=A0AAV9GIJ0_9PEZI|nr:hypothetical protein QBC34DRAFT_120901 [Podospora aff. communis PSN243]